MFYLTATKAPIFPKLSEIYFTEKCPVTNLCNKTSSFLGLFLHQQSVKIFAQNISRTIDPSLLFAVNCGARSCNEEIKSFAFPIDRVLITVKLGKVSESIGVIIVEIKLQFLFLVHIHIICHHFA